MNRSKRSAINIAAALIYNALKAILPFAIRTIIIYRLGEKYVGLGGLFTSILTVLNLTEFGFGSAVVFSMYKPMGEENYEKVSELLNYMRRIFFFVGCIVTLLGLLVCPFLRFLIKESVPEEISIYVLYLIYLLNTVASYFFGGYNRTVFQAGQRNDIISRIDSTAYLLMTAIQIFVLLVKPNYYLYIIWLPISAILSNLLISAKEKRFFREIRPKGTLEKAERTEIFNKVKALFLNKIGTVVFTSSDNIVISAFLGLGVIAYYGNYYQIINIPFTLTYTAFAAITSVIAHKINASQKEEIKRVFNTIQFWVCLVSGIFLTGFVLLAQDFMVIWMGKERLLDDSTVILLGILFYLLQFRRASIVLYDTQGLWDKSRFAPLLSGILNLVVNICLVQVIGLNGIVLSTIIATAAVSIPWELTVIFRHYLKDSPRSFIFENLKYILTIIVNTAVCALVIRVLPHGGIAGFLIRGVVIVVISVGVFWAFWRKSAYYKYGLQLFKNVLRKQ